jgi:hypothetical protein
VKIEQFSNASKPRIARFAELGDNYTLAITHEPEWIDDPFRSDEDKDKPDEPMLKVVGQDHRNIYWQLRAKTQMLDAIFDAILAAGVEEIVVGGRLTVEWVEWRGKAKVYKVTYEPPADSDSEPAF